MESLEAFGTNGTSDLLHPELSKSLLDSATLTPGLDGNESATRLQGALKTPTGKDPLQSQLDRLSDIANNSGSSKPNPQFSPDSTGVINTVTPSLSTSTPNNAQNQPPQSRIGRETIANATTNFDPLTGSTSNTPLVSNPQSDPLTQSSPSSKANRPVQTDDNIVNSKSSPDSPDGETGALLQQATDIAKEKLKTFLKQTDDRRQMEVAFGEKGGSDATLDLIQKFIENSHPNEIKFEILENTLHGSGAFAAATPNEPNTIYLDASFVRDNKSQPQAIANVILEEFGHYLDFSINQSDSPGDEGAIFSALVNSQPLNETQLAALKAEDDRATLTINGKTRYLEYASPTINANLFRDTAPNNTTNTDRITFDPTIVGQIVGTSQIKKFEAGFDSTPKGQFVDVSSALKSDGSFTLDRAQLNRIYGKTLPDGSYVLHLQAKDERGNSDKLLVDVSFTLDTTAPTAPQNLDLLAASDDGASDSDNITSITTPTIAGTATALVGVQLFSDGQLVGQTTANTNGNWQITTSTLTRGERTLSATATDVAGNVSAASAPLHLTIVANTPAPAAPSNLRLTAATDTGASNSDNITNNSTPTIQGNATAGLSVKLFKDGQLVGQTTANAQGNWQLSAGTLADGQYTFTATAEDSAGKISTASSQLKVKVDTTIAAPTGLDLLSSSDSGVSDSDNVTNQTTPKLAGSAEALAVVQLLSDGQVVGQATANAEGAWQITPTTPLTQGTHTLTAKATDVAGNISQASAPLNVVIDTTAPTAPSSLRLSAATDTGSSSSDGITNNPTPTVEGLAESGSLVRVYKDGQLLGQTSATSSGNWQLAVNSLSDGNYTFAATAEDKAGNLSNLSQALAVTVDTTAPAAPSNLDLLAASDSGSSDSDNITNQTTPKIAGTAAVGAIVQLFSSDGQLVGQTTANASGEWQLTTNPLKDGSYSLTAKATDVAGNISAASAALNVIVDTTAPAAPNSLRLTAVTDTGASNSDNITNNPTPTIQGNAAVGSLVKLFKNGQLVGQTTATSSGDWQLSAGTLADGQYAFTATAEDKAGNVSTASSSLTVKVDTTIAAPTGLDLLSSSDSGASDSDNVTNNTTPTVAGSAEALAVVQLLSDGQVVGQATTNENGNWQIAATTPLTQGTHTLTAKATDKAGNVSPASAPLNLVIDTAAPTAPSGLKLSAATDTGTSNSDGITNNPTPILEGLAEARSLVRAYKDGQLLGQTTATLNGNWQIAVAPLADGNYTFAATAEDSAGNVSSLSQPVTVTVDTAPPSPPSNLDLLAASDSGVSKSDNITNNPAPKIAGTATAGDRVQLLSGGTQLVGQTAADADGSWLITANFLADGNYTLTAKAQDLAGNVSSASAPLNLTIDTTAPSLNVIAPTANTTLTTGAHLSGTVGGTGTAIAALSYQWDSQKAIALTPNVSGDFDSALNLTGITSGSHTLAVTAQDVAGNATASSLSITVDVTPPLISANLTRDTAPLGTNADGITSDPGISGTISDISNITQFKAGLDATPVASFTDVLSSLKPERTFSFDRSQMNQLAGGTLSEGAHTLHLVATDALGNSSSVFDVAFTLDTTAPVLDLLTPVAAGNHSDTARLIGQVTDAGATAAGVVQYAIDGQPAVSLTTDSSGQFDAALQSSSLTAGSHSLVATGFDAAGNVTQQTSVDFQVTPSEFIKGPTASGGWGVKTADEVILGEQNSSLSQTTMPIALGQTGGSRKLRFDLKALFDKSDANTLAGDRFSAYLVDPAHPTQTLLDNGEPGTALFTLSERGAEFTPGRVRYDGQAVEVDLTSLTNYSSGLLVFQLLNGDRDLGSRVQVQQISDTVDPEGVASPVFPVQSNLVKAGSALDLSRLSPTNDLQVLLSNVRLDDTTGRYTAEVQVRNNGAAITGRQVAVVFPNLPGGVQLESSSGKDSTGAPYISLRDSIPSGGLASGATSDPVEVVFDNPNLLQFNLAATVLSGGANRAPVFDSVGQLSVMPGHRLEVPLVATDADGDTMTFTVKSDRPLPTGSLDGNGKLVFAPKPDEVGTYNFTLVATDGAAETSQDVQLTVAADPVTTTRVSGVIQNTSKAPLAGIAIEVGGVQTTTAADGSFELEFAGELPGNALKVHGEQASDGELVYPTIAEKLPLLLGHDVYNNVNNVISRPIYLPPLDVANGKTIDPNSDVTVTTPNIPGAAVHVVAGSLKDHSSNPFAGKLSITQVPTDLTPAALPENLHPDLVVTIQPGEMVFNTPAPLTLPNKAGYAPGSKMDLWSINPNTGLFDRVGTGKVSDDGSVIETIEGGIHNSSWHFFAPPPKDPKKDPRNPDKKCKHCEETGKSNSEVVLHSGTVVETHDLVPYQSLGTTRGLQLRYDSERADPRPIVHFGYDGYVAPDFYNYRLVANLTVSQGNFEYRVPGYTSNLIDWQNGYHFWSLPSQTGSVDAALQVDLRDRPTGQYTYKLQTGILRSSLLPGISEPNFTGTTDPTNSKIISVNSIHSPFGSGWGLAGWQEIVENDDGSALLVDGDGGQYLFEAPKTPGSAYVSPDAEPSVGASTLEKLADGTFRRTMKDKTVYHFNAQNKLESVADRNGNTTHYTYDTAGHLTQIVDPVGLTTTFTYSGDRASAITNPAGRTTQLTYDGAGNLIKIADPDGTARTWEYDTDHRMTAAVDKQGNRGEDVYDFAGRVTKAIRPDNSVVQVAPVQVQGLARPEATIDPVNAPTAFALGAAEASYADGNGNVVSKLLDAGGQAISAKDGAGTLPSVQRDSHNLVTRSINGRSQATDYTYDALGNVLSVKDELSTNATSSSLFPNPIYRTGGQPHDIAASDLDGDGFLDLVTANSSSNSVSVLFGDGRGSFGTANDFAAGGAAQSVAIGDLNGDGHLDLVSANIGANAVSILFGDGQGNFSAPTNLAIGDSRETSLGAGASVALGDLDGDNKLDIALATYGSGYGYEFNHLEVLLNDGSGSFTPQPELMPGNKPESVTLKDVNGDNRLDLVTANYGSDTISVRLGNGNGTFATPTDYEVGTRPDSMAIGDLNGDAKPDLVVDNTGSGSVSVLLGNGDGTFAPKTDYQTTGFVTAVALGDINGDASLDIVEVAGNGSGEVAVLLGRGDGTFATPSFHRVGNTPKSVIVRDVNSDGLLDLLSANSSDSTVSVLLGKGDGTFLEDSGISTGEYAVGSSPTSVALKDLDGDSTLDLVTANAADNSVSVLLGNGDGTLTPKVDYAVGNNPQSLVAGDLNGDRHLDLVTGNASDNSVSVLLGNGDGTFAPRTDYAVDGTPESIALGDVNSDGKLDLVTANPYSHSISVLLGNGDGTLAAPTTYTLGSSPGFVTLADLNSDGKLDLVTTNFPQQQAQAAFSTLAANASQLATANEDNPSVSVLLGNGDGTFAAQNDVAVGNQFNSVAVGDANGDGKLDLVTANLYDNSVSVLLGNGDGTFAPKNDYAVGQGCESVALGDMNGDGFLDIVTTNLNDYSVSVLLGNGQGVFNSRNRRDFAVENGPRAIALADLNVDGKLDFVTANSYGNNVSLRLNSPDVSRTVERRYTYDPVFNSVTSETDELGRKTLYEIDPLTGNQLSVTKVVGEVGGDDDVVTRYTYTASGQIDTMTDPLGRVTDYDYDAHGNLIKTTFALGTADEAVQRFEYDAAGNKTASIDEKGNRTEYVYDAMNRLVKEIQADPDGAGAQPSPVTTYTYDAMGNQLSVTDANSHVTRSEYDSMGHLVKTIDATGHETRTVYDKAGNKVSEIDALGRETKYRYDARNRLIETIRPDGTSEKPKYDFDNNQISTIDANGNRTNKVYDARGRLIREIDPLGNVTRYEYDAANQLIAQIDANGNRTQYKYDELGRQVAVIDALGNVTKTEYDKVGNVTASTDALGHTTRSTYDNRSRQTVVTDALGHNTTTTYDAVGNAIAQTDALGRITQFGYDALNRSTTVTDALGNATTTTYDAVGNVIADTDANGRTTRYSYDFLDRRTAVTDANGHTATTNYDADGNVSKVTDALGRITQFAYDSLNRRTAVTDALGQTSTITYDAIDNILAQTDALGRTTRYSYDALNRRTGVTDALGNQTTTTYDPNSNVTAIADALGHTTRYRYDVNDRRIAVIDANGQTTSTTYDAIGNVLSITDPIGNTTSYTYDPLDRLSVETNALGKSRSYQYDAVDNLIATTDRNGRKRSFTYDALSRQTQEKWLDASGNPIHTFNYAYDAANQLIAASDPDSAYTYAYDATGRLITVDNAGTPNAPNVLLNYTYDAVGNQLSVTDTINGQLKGTQSLTHDALNRVTRISQSGNGVTNKRVDMTYDAASQMTGVTRYADLTGIQLVANSNYTYDLAGRLTRLTHAKNATTLADYTWNYDAANRITQFTSPDGTSNYSYDDRAQLTGADYSYQLDEAYSYDANGNRTNAGYTTDTNNRLLSDGKYNYEYDNEGNRTKQTEIATGEVTEYTWDYRNRLTQFTLKDASGNVIKQAGYIYDVNNRRIAKEVDLDGAGSAPAKVERFVYDGDNIALTFDGNGTQTHRYLYGAEVDSFLADENASGVVLWALTDNQGTVRDLIDSTGTIQNHVTYDSFGQITNQTNPAVDLGFGYTGRERDQETGQYYYRARYYDSGIGQFISEDPIEFDSGDANLYRYVGNSPLNATDPTGNQVVAPPAPTLTPPPTNAPTPSPLPGFLKWLGPIGTILAPPGGGGILNPWQTANEDEILKRLQNQPNQLNQPNLLPKPNRPQPKASPTPTPQTAPSPQPAIPNPNCPEKEEEKKKNCETEYPQYSPLPQGLKFQAFQDTNLFSTIRLMKAYRQKVFNAYGELRQGKTEPMTKKRYKDPNNIATHYNINIVNGNGALGGSIGKYEFCIENENSPYIEERYGILNIKSNPDRKNKQIIEGSDP